MPQLRQLDGVFLKPSIALTVTDREPLEQIRKVIGGARHTVPLLLEIRIDRFCRFDETKILQRVHALKKLRLPLIATIRSHSEGGGRKLSDSKRLVLFKTLLPFVQIVDVELNSTRLRKALVELAHRSKKKVILSYHDFRHTPPDGALKSLVQKARRAGADWVKIAVTARAKSDVGRLLVFTQRHRNQNLIILSMGRIGQPSRILAPVFGSKLTYSFVGRSQALGQISLRRLLAGDARSLKNILKNAVKKLALYSEK